MTYAEPGTYSPLLAPALPPVTTAAAAGETIPPTDPRPRSARTRVTLEGAGAVVALDDFYSDRVRCDHPDTDDGARLGRALLDIARRQKRGAVMLLAPARLAPGLAEAGVPTAAVMPGFYRGRGDCVVAYRPISQQRARLADPVAVAHVDGIVRKSPRSPSRATRPTVRTHRAVPADAAEIARLIGRTFADYPTPSGVPDYIAAQIRGGVPFRFVRDDGRIVACASADLVRDARTAEFTDCATTPACRGRGYVQQLLRALMDDLREMGYPTAFSLARARVVGMNLALHRLGFVWRGRTSRSCRLGDGLEDVNVWSRAL